MSLKIDPLTSNFYHGTYVRVLVDVDFKQPLPGIIVAKMLDTKSNLYVSFFVMIIYEKLPGFCKNCLVFNHDRRYCKKNRNIQNKGKMMTENGITT